MVLNKRQYLQIGEFNDCDSLYILWTVISGVLVNREVSDEDFSNVLIFKSQGCATASADW